MYANKSYFPPPFFFVLLSVAGVKCAAGAGMVVLRGLHRRRPQAPSAFQAEGKGWASSFLERLVGVTPTQ